MFYWQKWLPPMKANVFCGAKWLQKIAKLSVLNILIKQSTVQYWGLQWKGNNSDIANGKWGRNRHSKALPPKNMLQGFFYLLSHLPYAMLPGFCVANLCNGNCPSVLMWTMRRLIQDIREQKLTNSETDQIQADSPIYFSVLLLKKKKKVDLVLNQEKKNSLGYLQPKICPALPLPSLLKMVMKILYPTFSASK